VTKLSASEASRDLGGVLARALNGEEIGIECEGRIIALQPVEDMEEATAEYGLKADEVERAFDSISKAVETERQAGKLRKLA
jgi:antitoxin (DNA-binding transcriptional repressor) of toxin-antitoxin stability system